MNYAAVLAAIAALAWYLTRPVQGATMDSGSGLVVDTWSDPWGAPASDPEPFADTAEASQLPTAWDAIKVTIDPSTYTPADTPDDIAARNLAAFLDMLAYSEGTSGPNGYRTMFGGGLFSSYEDHPRIAHQFTDRAGRTLWTSAAGRYQFMAVSPIPGRGFTRVNTWDILKAKLNLPDFTPDSQDAAAIELIRQRGALADVQAGRFALACEKCAKTWASLPGAGYDQPERKLAQLEAAYTDAGGIITA